MNPRSPAFMPRTGYISARWPYKTGALVPFSGPNQAKPRSLWIDCYLIVKAFYLCGVKKILKRICHLKVRTGPEMRTETLNEIREFLISGGFDIFEYTRGCFDIAAKRDRLFLLKILTNVGSFQRGQARDLKLLSSFLDSSCFLLGERTRRERLKESVVYERFGVPVMTPDTFTSVIDGDYPEKFRTRGGTFGELDPSELRRYRKMNDMTQSELAEELGISQKSVSEHESGKKRALFDIVKAFEELLDEDIRKGINPFDIEPEVEDRRKGNKICRRLVDMGFRTGSVQRAPSKLLAKSDRTVLSRVVKREEDKKELDSLANFSRISEAEAFIITTGDENIDIVPPINIEELEDIDSSGELVKLIEEKKESVW